MKTFFIYLALVGLPGLGILGALRAGEGLSAPASVGGSWSVELDGRMPEGGPCAALLTGPGPAVLSVTQSGTRLQLSLGGGTSLSGEIERGGVSAASVPQRGGGAAGRAHVRLTAALEGPERLRGSLVFEGCPGEAAVSFTATRRSAPRAGGR